MPDVEWISVSAKVTVFSAFAAEIIEKNSNRAIKGFTVFSVLSIRKLIFNVLSVNITIGEKFFFQPFLCLCFTK